MTSSTPPDSENFDNEGYDKNMNLDQVNEISSGSDSSSSIPSERVFDLQQVNEKFKSKIEVIVLDSDESMNESNGSSHQETGDNKEEKDEERLGDKSGSSSTLDLELRVVIDLEAEPQEGSEVETETSIGDGIDPDILEAAAALLLFEERMDDEKKQVQKEEESKRVAVTETVRQKALQRQYWRERDKHRIRESVIRMSRSQSKNQPVAIAPVEVENIPSSFSTALKIIEDRSTEPIIKWTPTGNPGEKRFRPMVPSLQDLCISNLAKNVEAIVSLAYVPDVLRHKLTNILCDSRKMNYRFMELLASGSPTEIRVKDCSWLTEEDLTKILKGCDSSNLMVLQLDLCGRCVSDYLLQDTLAQSPYRFLALSSISLRGTCRLTDIGLKKLVAAAPSLRSISLRQCSLLTSIGIDTLAESLGSMVRELYLDECQNIDMMLILPALKKLERLEILSLSDNLTVCDDFVCDLVSVCGPTLKELFFANCGGLTNASLKAISEHCPGLRAIDLCNLDKLTDASLAYLANGCRSIQILKLQRNNFSDEVVAAFIEASGKHLTELSLNYVKKVGNHTAMSLAKCCSNQLVRLDLSWCRNLTDAALGLIVDSCSSLKILKLFGCTQITTVFVDGHSNPFVRLVGLNLSPILERINVHGIEESQLH